MARRTYRRSYSGIAKASDQGRPYVTWPSIQGPVVAPYASILAHQTSAPRGGCSPEDVTAILRVGRVPAIREVLSGLSLHGDIDAHLTGILPPPPTVTSALPDEPTAPIAPVEPLLADFVAPASADTTLKWIARSLFGERGPTPEERQRFQAAQRRWQADMRAWEATNRRWKDAKRRYENLLQLHHAEKEHVAAARKEHEVRSAALIKQLEEAKREALRQRQDRDAQVARDAAEMERLLSGATEATVEGVARLARAVWHAIPLPADFPRDASAEFDPEIGALLFTVYAPDFERVPLSTRFKTGRKPVGDRARRLAQQTISYALPLRIAHEVYATPELGCVSIVGVNVRLAFIDPRTGNPREELIASMMASREEFETINISNVDAKKCFRSFKGVESPSFDDVSAVIPLLEFDRNDKRLVEGRNVMDGLAQSTNLAEMDWEDFEHVVRELFSKMFTARSEAAEVHVTRASRDYGVDAIVYDPDPIMGGKYVIQAKRYVNTVDVAAVRDLFGTVQNEGASKGFLVTTSSFGPDAHQFAKGKPLTLIDGRKLLTLLTQHGYEFRIDLAAARKALQGR